MLYSVFRHTVNIDGKEVATNGIKVCNEKGDALRILYDVSTDFNAVSALTERLNQGGVESVHLDGILEDFYSKYP